MTRVPEEIVRALGGIEPTPQQWAAISHPRTPCAIVAGAGSGKTAVMAARVVYLTLAALGRTGGDGAMPSQILCLTFTNKAAEELSRRVRAATLPLALPEGEEATVLTYHSFAARLLEEEGLRMGLEPGQMLLSTAHRWQIVRSLLVDREFEHLQMRSLAHPIRRVLALADACANHLIDPLELARHSRLFADTAEPRSAGDREAVETARERAELAELVDAYQKRKAEMRAVDYGDQIAYACRLVEEHPEVAEAFRERFPAVLLDEYQDTNHAQGRLLSLLCPPGSNVMCVGDPDQNIYAWRGASLRNILRFAGDFGGVELPLTTNFRSGSRILDVANRVIESVPPERRAPGKRLDPHAPLGEGRVVAFAETDQRGEARRIAGMIREARAGGTLYSEIAVLCRKKRLMGPIADVLREEGIPIEVVDLSGLLQLPEIVDVVAWLRLLNDPSDNVAFARIAQSPRWRIGYRDLAALARWSRARNAELRVVLDSDEDPADVAFSLVESLDALDDPSMIGLSDEARARLRDLAALLAGLRRSCAGSLDDLLARIVEESGLMRELETRRASASARRNVLNFAAAVSGFAPVEGEATLSSLVEYLETAEDSEEDLEQAQLSEAETVKLLTIHKAKGLEWDVVFVPGLATSRRSEMFPDTSRQPNEVRAPEHLPFALRGDREVLPRYEGNLNRFRDALRERGLEEERRLCYVALTRARRTLVVSHAWWYDGPKDPFEPSVFFQEISSHPACTMEWQEECPESNPLIAHRLEAVPQWPLPARTVDVPGDLDAAIAALGPPGTEARDAFDAELARLRERVGAVAAHADSTLRPAPPPVLSVSAAVTLAACPRTFWDRYVRPLPERPSRAARKGDRIHRWIELASTGREDEIGPDDLVDEPWPGEASGDGAADASGDSSSPPTLQQLARTWRDSRFGGVRPRHSELPFVLWLDGRPVSGRIDAILEDDDGAWEIVDYKSGEHVERGEPDQLALYAKACEELWPEHPVKATTYAYLADGAEDSRPPESAALTRLPPMPTTRPEHSCRLCDPQI